MQLNDLLKNRVSTEEEMLMIQQEKNNTLMRKYWEKYQTVYSWELLLLSLFLKVFP